MCEVVGLSGVVTFTGFLYQLVCVSIEVYLTCMDEKNQQNGLDVVLTEPPLILPDGFQEKGF